MDGLIDEMINLYNKYTLAYLNLADEKAAILAA